MARSAGAPEGSERRVDQPLLQERPASPDREVGKLAEHLISLPLIGAKRLRAERVYPGAVATSCDGFCLGHVEHLAGYALAAQTFRHEEPLREEPAPAGIAGHP